MTTNKLLQATGDELSRMLGEVLLGEHKNMNGRCSKCLIWCDYQSSPCCKIEITWESAMTWRDWAVGEYGEAMFMENLLYAMVDDGLLSPKESRTEIISGIVAKTQPEHYLNAAALCKLKQDKE